MSRCTAPMAEPINGVPHRDDVAGALPRSVTLTLEFLDPLWPVAC